MMAKEKSKSRRRLSPVDFSVSVLVLTTLILIPFILKGCDRAHFTLKDSSTTYGLADVTGAKGMSGKYSVSYPTASVWYDNQNAGEIIICYHNRDLRNFTNRPTECHRWGVPTQLQDYQRLLFLGVNEGIGQKTQTVWMYYPVGSNNAKMVICDHENDWLSKEIATATSCNPFPVPSQIDRNSILASLNSGQNIAAQSFWINPDNTVSMCTHDKNSTGFLGLGGLAFGPAISCSKMPIPYNLFPEGAINLRLTAINKDSQMPWESWWQDQDGKVYYCEHDRHDNGLFTNDTIGDAKWCDYWYGIKPSDIS